MHYLFEDSDMLNSPFECFYFNSADEQFPIRPHWHYFTEIIYMIDGNAEMRCNEQNYYLGKGQMIIFHPKAVHSIFSSDGKSLRYAVIKFDINRLNLTASYAPKLRSIFRCAEKSGMNILFDANEAIKLNAEQIFDVCITEINTRKYGFDLNIRSRLYELLINMIRIWLDKGFVVDSDTFAEDSMYDIYNITEYIDENIREGITVEDIAKKCSMSYSYFAKMFRKAYGRTCKEYIEEMRLYKAEEFLVFTDFDLNYISQETGFSDCSHMIKSFKAKRGITPKQYRLKKRS